MTTANRHSIRCRNCFALVREISAECDHCRPDTVSDRLRNYMSDILGSLRREMSPELTVLSIEDEERMFSEREIEALLDPGGMTALETRDVPCWETMFCDSRRIPKPKCPPRPDRRSRSGPKKER